MNYDIPFNKPYLTGKEAHYMYDAVYTGKISGNGKYTQLCQRFFETTYSIKKCLLTTSCTDALEMAAILINISPGDEVILPSYTFVSTANAFALRGAKLIFADSREDHPGLDEHSLPRLLSTRTKAIVPVHYAGVACDMDAIMEVAKKNRLWVIEDAAQAVDGYYVNSKGEKRPLGTIGHLGAFSFHETKNIISGEGGMLNVNDSALVERAEIVWEKGTNRSAFFRGETDKYSWKDLGSSYLPSEIIAAFLWAQIENISTIQSKRIQIWNAYKSGLQAWAERLNIRIPYVPPYSTNNAHNFYLVCTSSGQRDQLINHLKSNGIYSVFHYLSLHKSEYYRSITPESEVELPWSDTYSECLVRLPFFYEMTEKEQRKVITKILEFED